MNRSLNVLFISSDKNGKINPIIKAQGESLKNQNVNVDYFLIKKPGIKGYLRSILELRRLVKSNDYDICHAHYSLSGIVASLGYSGPVITSLMGSDVNKNLLMNSVAKLFAKKVWNHTIVKSKQMSTNLSGNRVSVIPNGVDISSFKWVNKINAQKKLGWNNKMQHILFAANPDRPEKNFGLAKKAFKTLSKNNQNVELHTLINIPHSEIANYMNASDVILLTSKWEGSPNVIKEAMACNRPIVCTDVGDVRWLFGNLPGHYISKFDAIHVSHNIQKAINFATNEKSTIGRRRIKELNLDDNSVALKLREVYQESMSGREYL